MVQHSVEACESCGASLSAVAAIDYERLQVHELPPLRLQVIEHQAEIKCCAQCEWHTRGQFPSAVTSSVHYRLCLELEKFWSLRLKLFTDNSFNPKHLCSLKTHV